jgi:hypothetical protein
MNFQWVDSESFLSSRVLAEIDSSTQCLFGLVRTIKGGLPLSHFLCESASALHNAQDVAALLNMPIAQVISILERLQQFGVVASLSAEGITWYHISDDPQQRKMALNLCAWQNHWHDRLKQTWPALYDKSALMDSAA